MLVSRTALVEGLAIAYDNSAASSGAMLGPHDSPELRTALLSELEATPPQTVIPVFQLIASDAMLDRLLASLAASGRLDP